MFLPFGSVDSSFPTVTLYFMGGVAMSVKPENYLLQQASVVSHCISGLIVSLRGCLKCYNIMSIMVAGQQCIVVHWLAKEPGPRNNYTWRLASLTLDTVNQFRLRI